MMNFEQFCKEWDMEEEDMERELFKTLKAIHNKEKVVILNDGKFFYAKINYLVKGQFIERGSQDRTTLRGEEAINRGWVTINIPKHKKQKRRELWGRITPHILQGISILVAIILGILGLFFPRQGRSDSASNIKDIVPCVEENVIDAEPQIDKIAQATDSTKQKNCNNDK